jgi:hypothetical protein
VFPGAFHAEDLTYSSRGRFRDPVPVSAGGSAAVFQAFDISLGTRVAVKVSHGTLEANHCLREEHRLLTGPLAQIAEPGREPTACKCFGLVEVEGRVALVLEYLDPAEYQPLDELTRDHGLTEYETLTTLLPFFSLLAAAHEQGVVYNDVGRDKADHLRWNAASRQLKVIDWANAIDTTRASSTQTRRPYHDVVGCGELALLVRLGAETPTSDSDALDGLGELGTLVRRCLNFADADSFATAQPLEQAARQRLWEIEREFAAAAERLRVLFATGNPETDFESAKAQTLALRELIPSEPALLDLDLLLRAWTASLTARNLISQAEDELRAGQPVGASQKLRLVLNLLRGNPDLRLQRGEAHLRLLLAFCEALQELPSLLPAGALASVLDADAGSLPDVSANLLRALLDADGISERRDAEPGFAADLLGSVARCAGVRVWSVLFHELTSNDVWIGDAERLTALHELRRGLKQLVRARPSDDIWGDLVGSYEGLLDEIRGLQEADPESLPGLDEDIERALVLARRAQDEWGSGEFSSAIGMLAQLREADPESRAASLWAGHARAVDARWGFPADPPHFPTAVTWLLTEESPAAVAFLLRDAVSELESWAKSAPGIRDTAGLGEPSYLESLRLVLEAFLRIFEYLGVPRQRHPAQKLALRALIGCMEAYQSVHEIRVLGQQLLASDRDDVAWQFANEAVQISQAMDDRRRDRPIFRKITTIGQPQIEAPNTQLIDILQRLNVASVTLPLLSTLTRLPEFRYQAALAYCELGDLEGARAVLADLQIVGTRSDDIVVRATSLHRALSLAILAAEDVRDGDPLQAIPKIDQALHEIDVNQRYRHEFRALSQLLKERKNQLIRPDSPPAPARAEGLP